MEKLIEMIVYASGGRTITTRYDTFNNNTPEGKIYEYFWSIYAKKYDNPHKNELANK